MEIIEEKTPTIPEVVAPKSRLDRLRQYDAHGREITPEEVFRVIDRQVSEVTHSFDNAPGLGLPYRKSSGMWLEVANNEGDQVARVNGFFDTIENCSRTRDDLIGALRSDTEASGNYRYFVNTMREKYILGSNDV